MNGRVLLFVLISLVCWLPSGKGADTEKPIAHWSFDQSQGEQWPDQSGREHDATAGKTTALQPSVGLLQGGVQFKGKHRLATPSHQDFADLDRVTFSAWVRPDKFDRYNEIFRKEDGTNRLLFAFQENGSILSLGLNTT